MKKLCKSSNDKKIAGVCGGIAEYFGIDSTIVRVALILFCCMGGSGLLAYILAACIMPEDDYIDYED
ncbi:MAG: PspC domain-containing protein [Lachnospiraceae bacterium]|nr:PspC domain-containing protein [Lachnospiraceae bacterium]